MTKLANSLLGRVFLCPSPSVQYGRPDAGVTSSGAGTVMAQLLGLGGGRGASAAADGARGMGFDWKKRFEARCWGHALTQLHTLDFPELFKLGQDTNKSNGLVGS